MHGSHAVSMKKGREKGRDVLGNSSPATYSLSRIKKRGKEKLLPPLGGDVQLFEVGRSRGGLGGEIIPHTYFSSGISQLALFWRYDCDGGYCP